ncbi:thiopeptide-type bacteriocin biosynthesis protein [Pseudoalteromonas rubra]|uniref:Thiopeptide-type bacteriocin biosynthesis domain-containing protein n=1 Tax=Pseudoalteromonas rubra TaxID=43658 RepID=A0A0F4QXY0_9GAMM|nr:thiopeptide-type bacteriocin biosynthesis protein [Pseudoalteromonas rubra]KJZ11437.1 hypothetical protein TW77_06065 [Pseudoalteromonas rubra]
MNEIINKNKVNWVYVKLYVGKNIDRLDQLIVKVSRCVEQFEDVDQWFFIRYVDDQGVHLRLRLRSKIRDLEQFKNEIQQVCAPLVNALHELLPSTYYPMVKPEGFEDSAVMGQELFGHKDVQIIFDEYEPEYDKYGGSAGIKAAEVLFQLSSELAKDILADEIQGFYSRKDLVPLLMHECCEVFIPQEKRQEFWKEYAFYWLGGNTPAAEDWREKFIEKWQQLREANVELLTSQLDPRKQSYIDRWRAGLREAAKRYHDIGDIADFSEEVLCFNFAHLMNNRLGIASLEESYMATLLECKVDQAEVA